jgi:hypothetical protein
LNEVLYGTRDFFDRYRGIHTMLIIEIDGIHPEPLERTFDRLLDMLRTAIQADPTRTSVGFELISELGGDDDLPAKRSEGLTHKFFVRVRAVDLGGIKEGDAAFHGGMEKRRHLLLVFARPIRKAHSHAA